MNDKVFLESRLLYFNNEIKESEERLLFSKINIVRYKQEILSLKKRLKQLKEIK